MGVSNEEKRDNGTKSFEEIVTENFPSLMEAMSYIFRGLKSTPNRPGTVAYTCNPSTLGGHEIRSWRPDRPT